MSKLILIFIVSLFFSPLSVLAKNSYLIKQETKLFGLHVLYLSANQFNLLNTKLQTQVYCQKPDYVVYYINHKSKVYFATPLNNVQDPQGFGIISFLVNGGKLIKNPDYWQKKNIYKNKNYSGIVYKFKYPDTLKSKVNIFNELIISDNDNINPNFIKLHSKLNGFPIMPGLILELNFIFQRRENERSTINELITTRSIEKLQTNITKPNLQTFHQVNSYNEYLGISSNKKILNDFFDLTR